MKVLFPCVCGVSLLAYAACYAQVDIFQSDAYSVEEMCAREAEQETERGYTDYYEYCIEQNRARPMYQSRHEAAHSPPRDQPDTCDTTDDQCRQ